MEGDEEDIQENMTHRLYYRGVPQTISQTYLRSNVLESRNGNDEYSSDIDSTDEILHMDYLDAAADTSDALISQPQMPYQDDSDQMPPVITTTPQPSDPSIADIPIDPQNLTKPVVDIFRSWLQAHLDHPYPNDQDKLLLANRTGLTLSQVIW